MPPKRNKSKISFKIFSSENYSKFANRFPFLEERQIKAKLLQAWRNRFTTDTTKTKGEIKITKHRREAPFNEGKTDFFCLFYALRSIRWCCVISLRELISFLLVGNTEEHDQFPLKQVSRFGFQQDNNGFQSSVTFFKESGNNSSVDI